MKFGKFEISIEVIVIIGLIALGIVYLVTK